MITGTPANSQEVLTVQAILTKVALRCDSSGGIKESVVSGTTVVMVLSLLFILSSLLVKARCKSSMLPHV